ncbi:hypothetical protein F1188_00195 [Roseospira marina]|uniref:Uncharacterized protein n=1 Tax=Roseospira marina TaxID=140057 RepID=A0A5M6II05_9PROT|nr:DUF6524 family protein [Roseospira marina]KAA5607228.1 hypothetical protein F1188_00195 [Roseospira marina]MBB4312621.1 NADH:ubiquinone oxidoreductase subunit K [Roseospira marina]MBB5085363.1 NADH:ubiquinone oxidoreductase subunit K [Roseospira marina]
MARRSFSFIGIVIRWIAAAVLVLATFNPTDYSLVSWVGSTGFQQDLPLKVLLAVVLLIGYVLFVMATLRSIGKFGIILLLILFAVLIWVFVEYTGAVLDGDILVWLGLFIVATIMAIGMSWSHIWRRMTGQVDVDEPDI